MTQAVMVCLLVLAGYVVPPETALADDAMVTTCDQASFDAALAYVQASGGGTINIVCSGTIIFTYGKTITSDVTIIGGSGTILDGGGGSLLFWVDFSARLALVGLTVQNGHNTGQGGAIRNLGTLEITATTFKNNVVDEVNGIGAGGAIANFGLLTVTDSIFSGNRAGFEGGAIANAVSWDYGGTLTITDSIFLANFATWGGAIHNYGGNDPGRPFGAGTMTITSSTFSGNVASAGGGAIFNRSGDVSTSNFISNSATEGGAILTIGRLPVTASSFILNRASDSGGALFNSFGPLLVTASTFNGNSAGISGGAIDSNSGQPPIARTEIVASTIVGNVAPEAAAIRTLYAYTRLQSSVVANNSGGTNCFREPSTGYWGQYTFFQSYGYNLADDDTCGLIPGQIPSIGDRVGNFPINLGPPQYNGGPTPTMLPGEGSALIDAANCDLSSEQDQRGVPRPVGLSCDIGAVEAGENVIQSVKIVTVYNNGPVLPGQPVEIGVVARGPEGSALTYEFDCANDGTFELSQVDDASAACTFTELGSHVVAVRAGDGTNSATGQTTVEVLAPRPTVGSLTLEPSPSDEGEAVALTAGFTNFDPSSTHSCAIDWGDGSGPEAGTVDEQAGHGTCAGNHTYADAGIYTVSVTMTNMSAGLTASDATQHIVGGSDPITTCDEASFDIALARVQALGGGAITIDCNDPIIFTSQKTITSNVTIIGNGAILDGGNSTRLFMVSGQFARLALADLTLRNGNESDHLGGAILLQAGTVEITASTISGNTAGDGGAIFNLAGSVAVTASTFSSNTAGDGGAIADESGRLLVKASTFSGNTASRDGGAIWSNGTQSLAIAASTFSDNSATSAGGAISSAGSWLVMQASTVSGNSASRGGAISLVESGMTVMSTILAGDSSGIGNCDITGGTFTSGGSNLSDDETCNLTATGDIQNSTNVNLGPLADNGGPTQTMLPQSDSAAINAADCALSAATDQRGFPRPLTNCDIGAVEVEGLPVPAVSALTIDPSPSDAGAEVELTTSFTSPNPGAAFTCLIDWGDGSEAASGTVEEQAGGGTCTGDHTYDHVGNYTVTVSVTDTSFDATGSNTTKHFVVGSSSITTCDEASFDLALAAAQAAGGGTITIECSDPIIFTSQKTITSDVTIVGNGAILDGNDATRLFMVESDARLALNGLTLRNGNDSEVGGAIFNRGTLEIAASTFSGNNAPRSGGAIVNTGTVSITSTTFNGNSTDGQGGAIINTEAAGSTLEIAASVFSGNQAGVLGGAIVNAGALSITNTTFGDNGTDGQGGAIATAGQVTITASTFSGNRAGVFGGAVAIAGTLEIAASTFSGNSTDGQGGAIASAGQVTLRASTFSGNSADDGGGGALYNTGSGTMTVGASILANSPAGGNCAGSTTSQGSNLSDDETCNLTATGDIQNSTNVNLGPLADNGGPTQTMLPQNGSAAINAADCTLSSATDQRGLVRPAEGCDIGAVEVQEAVPAISSLALDPDSSDEGAEVTLSASFTNPNPNATHTCTIDWGDGAVESGTVTAQDGSGACTGNHTYADDGDYAVKVEICSTAGCDDTTATQTVNNLGPVITSVANDGPIDESGSVTITVIADDPGGENDPLKYAFDCDGDGSHEIGPQTEDSASCAFDDSGSYTVTVRVTDDGGGEAESSTVVTVNNVAPTVEAPIITPSPSNESAAVTLTASFLDSGADDGPFTCQIEWGDGTTTDGVVTGLTCTGSHTYPDDRSNGSSSDEYQIGVTVTDKDGGNGIGNAAHTVNNVAPTLSNLSAPPTDENNLTALSGDISDPGVSDSFTLTIDWGDDSTPETFSYGVGTTSFSETHQYPNVVGDYPGTAILCDDDEGCETANFTVTVPDRAAPTITLVSLTPANDAGWNNTAVTVTWSCADADSGVVAAQVSQTLDSEGQGQSITGTCEDTAGNTISHTVSGINIDQTAPLAAHGGPYSVAEGAVLALNGSGSTDALSGLEAMTWDLDGDGDFETASPALFSALDGPSSYTVVLQVTDLAGNVTTGQTMVEVTNVAPEITGITAGMAGAEATVTVEATDPAGALDPLSYAFDCNNDGEYEVVASDSNSTTCNFGVYEGTFQIGIQVSDDDGGITTDAVTATIVTELCANDHTGVLRYSDDCHSHETSITLPDDGPVTVCASTSNGLLRVPANGSCAGHEVSYLLPEDGPLSVCVSTYTQTVRAVGSLSQCASHEFGRAIAATEVGDIAPPRSR